MNGDSFNPLNSERKKKKEKVAQKRKIKDRNHLSHIRIYTCKHSYTAMGTYKSTSIPSISHFKALLSAFNTSAGQLIYPVNNNALESDSGGFLLICVKK